MQTYDAQAAATLLATLTARAEWRQFRFTVKSVTTPRSLDHPYVRMRPRGPAPWTMVQWAAVYRSPDKTLAITGPIAGVGVGIVGQDVYPGVSRTFGIFRATDVLLYGPYYEAVVVDNSDSTMAQVLMLLWAQQCFDQHDLRMQQAARPPQKVP